MTNPDRLQEIRERAEKATPGPWEVDSEIHPAIESANEQLHIYDEGGHDYDDAIFIAKVREDIPYLLQLVTEQQREIERLQNYHEALTELKEHIEAIAAADKDEWKASGLEAVATMLRMWHIEGVQEMKQELRALKNPPSTDEAKGYRKQERPM